MGFSRIFGVCAALLLAASSVNAAVTIDLGPSDYRNWGTGTNSHTGAGLRSSTGQTVRMPPLNGNLNVTRNAVIPYGSLANGMRNFLRINPASVAASAAVAGLFVAVDWVFDQAEGEWRKQGYDTLEDNSLDLWCSALGNCGPTPEMVCRDVIDLYPDMFGTWTYDSVRSASNPNTALCYGTSSSFQTPQLYLQVSINPAASCPAPYEYNEQLKACTIPALVPLEGSDWSDLEAYLPLAPANEVGMAGHDTQRLIGNPLPGFHDQTITGPSSVTGPETTTTTTTSTGDTVVTTTQTTTNISYGDTTVTATNTTVTNTYTNGNHTSTETTTETPGELPVTQPSPGGAAAEWPGFCEWASIVCEWIGWTQEEPPAEPDLPQVIDDDFYQEKTIQFGSKTCPPDYEINIPFINSTVAVPMQPLCDFAGIIYYMVMAAAYIIAAYITIGVARNG